MLPYIIIATRESQFNQMRQIFLFKVKEKQVSLVSPKTEKSVFNNRLKIKLKRGKIHLNLSNHFM